MGVLAGGVLAGEASCACWDRSADSANARAASKLVLRALAGAVAEAALQVELGLRQG